MRMTYVPNSCADPESFVRAGQLDFEKIPLKSISMMARHSYGVLLASRKWPYNKGWLGSFVIFQGIWTSIAKKPYRFELFRGVGGGSGHTCLLLPSLWICTLILFDLFLYVPSTIFQLNREGSSWVEPVLS